MNLLRANVTFLYLSKGVLRKGAREDAANYCRTLMRKWDFNNMALQLY